MRTPLRVPLHFSPRAKADELRNELSAVVQVGNDLFLGSDEGTSVERLSPTGEGLAFGRHVSFPLASCLDLPGADDEEVDVEGLGVSDGDHWLWVVGSHSPRRASGDDERDDDRKRMKRLARVKRGGNRYLLARVPLAPDADGARAPVRTLADGDDAGGTRHAARLPGGRRTNALVRALRHDEHFAPFLDLPGKDNGFNVEGLAVAGERLVLGLRGPVLDGWGAVLVVEPHDGDAPGALALRRIGRRGRRYVKHFLDLRGLGVRELHAHGDDLYVLAAPTMTLDGRATVLRWRGGCHAKRDSVIDRGDLEPVFDLPYGRGDDELVEHPEGLAVVTVDGRRGLLVVYDAPARDRQRGREGIEADFYPFG